MLQMRPVIFILSILLSACSAYRVESVRSGELQSGAREVAIGFFETYGGRSDMARRNFYDGLSFSLREKGFHPAEAQEIKQLFDRAELPSEKNLNPNELVRLASQYPGRLFLQGRIDEVKTETLLEDRIQVMVSVSVYELKRGSKIAEIQVFGKDLEYRTGRESLEMARLVSSELEKMAGLKP